MERRFIKSGISGLDAISGGGFLEGSVLTVSGPTGAGKSTFAAQFLYNGAKEMSEPGLYISIEESRADFFFHLGGYAWDFEGLERDRKFILLDYPIHEVDQIVNQAGAIQEIINTTGVKRVVIDSIMPIALYFKEEERKKGFLKFIDNIRKWETTTLIVSEDLKISSGSMPSTEFGIESFTDGWINLFFRYDEKRMERQRFAEVIKMKGVAHSSRAYPAVLDKNGFRIIHELTGKAEPKKEPLIEEKSAPEKKAPEKAEKAQRQKIAPAKMSPELAAKLAEAKSRIIKKR